MTLIMMAKQPRQIIFLFNRPVHCHRSRVCENAEDLSRLIIRPRFHKCGYRQPTAFSQMPLQATDRVFTNAATRAFSTSRLQQVS
jgi:hypothetical protein